jgi:hypothetical protein
MLPKLRRRTRGRLPFALADFLDAKSDALIMLSMDAFERDISPIERVCPPSSVSLIAVDAPEMISSSNPVVVVVVSSDIENAPFAQKI